MKLFVNSQKGALGPSLGEEPGTYGARFGEGTLTALGQGESRRFAALSLPWDVPGWGHFQRQGNSSGLQKGLIAKPA